MFAHQFKEEMNTFKTGIDPDKHNGVDWLYISLPDGGIRFYHPENIEKYNLRREILKAKGMKEEKHD
jgi:hypothetical protein